MKCLQEDSRLCANHARASKAETLIYPMFNHLIGNVSSNTDRVANSSSLKHFRDQSGNFINSTDVGHSFHPDSKHLGKAASK